MTASYCETSITETDNASISMHTVAFCATTNDLAGKTVRHDPVHVCAHETLPVVAVDQGACEGPRR